jgi:hypothetical protein
MKRPEPQNEYLWSEDDQCTIETAVILDADHKVYVDHLEAKIAELEEQNREAVELIKLNDKHIRNSIEEAGGCPYDNCIHIKDNLIECREEECIHYLASVKNTAFLNTIKEK